MVIPAQRLSDLESAAWQTDKRLDRIEGSLFDLHEKTGKLQEKADQHAIALSATMQDLRDLRIDVGQMAKVLNAHTATLADHTATLAEHTAMLEAIVKHFGIEVPEREVVSAA